MSYSKIIILDLPDDISDKDLLLVIFMVRMAVKNREYTGYKEIDKAGIDLDYFLERTSTKVNKKGCVKIDMKFINHFIIHSFTAISRYYLDTDIFKYEYDIFGAFKRRDPVWFTSYNDYNTYDEELLKELPEDLQKWFLRRLKKGTLTPAQELLERTYKKYVVRGEPVLSMTTENNEDTTVSLSNSSTKGSSI